MSMSPTDTLIDFLVHLCTLGSKSRSCCQISVLAYSMQNFKSKDAKTAAKIKIQKISGFYLFYAPLRPREAYK